MREKGIQRLWKLKNNRWTWSACHKSLLDEIRVAISAKLKWRNWRRRCELKAS